MIQLLDENNKVIYELETSEMFPDYRSVLVEAIALNVDLTGLRVESESINNVVWRGIDMSTIIFARCSMQHNTFIECSGKTLVFENCDLTSAKFKKSNLDGMHIGNSNLSLASFRDSFLYGSFIIDCDFSNASFYKSNIGHTCFHTCTVSEAIFNECCLDEASFIHGKSSKEWMNDTFFIGCSVKACNMSYVDDISLLYFWDTNLRDIEFKENEKFVEIIHDNSKVIYAINSDVVWWKPYSWNGDEKQLFRGTFKALKEEVENEFPTTDLYPCMADYKVEDELLKVLKLLELWYDEACEWRNRNS